MVMVMVAAITRHYHDRRIVAVVMMAIEAVMVVMMVMIIVLGELHIFRRRGRGGLVDDSE